MMFTQILLLLVGLALIVFGADWLVDGASSIARRAGISEFVIGLTIVGFGTSCPELVVSLTGAIAGNADISVGNVVGSNIFNTLLILGLTAAIMPVIVTESNRRRDIPVTAVVTALLVALWYFTREISRIAGIAFLLLFIVYIIYSFKKDSGAETTESSAKSGFKDKLLSSIAGAILFVAAGLAGLIFGGDLFVDAATNIAKMLGVSDKFIAITVLAAGTSLPELATSVTAAIKGRGQMALGNILGSNVFNILLILGLSAVITPLSMAQISLVDMMALLSTAVLMLVFLLTGDSRKIDRWEGVVMLLFFAAYYVYLFSTL